MQMTSPDLMPALSRLVLWRRSPLGRAASSNSAVDGVAADVVLAVAVDVVLTVAVLVAVSRTRAGVIVAGSKPRLTQALRTTSPHSVYGAYERQSVALQVHAVAVASTLLSVTACCSCCHAWQPATIPAVTCPIASPSKHSLLAVVQSFA